LLPIRSWLRAVACALCGVVLAFSMAVAQGFSHDAVVEEAQRLAAAPYRAPERTVPPELRDLSYTQYQNIRFRPDQSPWRDVNGLFRVQLFPTGFLFEQAVAINIVDGQEVRPLVATSEMFDWSDARLKGEPPRPVPLAGFRLHYPLHGSQPVDEIIAFLGASYLRLIGREQVYGASARGIAIDTGLPRREEFPFFRSFWLVTPAPAAREVVIHALLDSAALAGGYTFVVRPGTRTEVEVTASLFMRHDVSLLGVAPLTSMFFTGEGRRRRETDYRPEVHDSDGLFIATGNGERIWRPLDNPAQLNITSFSDKSPRGFGLMQRDRDFDHYQDLQARYEKRPSLWVEPIGDWGEGEVRLLEIPSDREIHDNIGAFWVPREPARKGQRIDLRYRLHALLDESRLSPGGRVMATRQAPAMASGSEQAAGGKRRVMIDFAGGDLDWLRPGQPVQGHVSTSSGKVSDVRVEPLGEKRGWRLVFDVEPDGKKPADLRAHLRLYDEALTETWNWVLRP
jgi:glucans biosynthesis protein